MFSFPKKKLENEFAEQSRENEGLLVCILCRYVATSGEQMSKHMEEVHGRQA